MFVCPVNRYSCRTHAQCIYMFSNMHGLKRVWQNILFRNSFGNASTKCGAKNLSTVLQRQTQPSCSQQAVTLKEMFPISFCMWRTKSLKHRSAPMFLHSPLRWGKDQIGEAAERVGWQWRWTTLQVVQGSFKGYSGFCKQAAVWHSVWIQPHASNQKQNKPARPETCDCRSTSQGLVGRVPPSDRTNNVLSTREAYGGGTFLQWKPCGSWSGPGESQENMCLFAQNKFSLHVWAMKLVTCNNSGD